MEQEYYKKLFAHVDNLLQNLTFTIVIYDTATKENIYLNRSKGKHIEKIIYDYEHKEAINDYPENYFCRNRIDLEQIIIFMVMNPELYDPYYLENEYTEIEETDDFNFETIE